MTYTERAADALNDVDQHSTSLFYAAIVRAVVFALLSIAVAIEAHGEQ
jgi:hypothetical protein